jgi:hypothetical protein
MSSRRRIIVALTSGLILVGGALVSVSRQPSGNPLVGRLLPESMRVSFDGTVEQTLRAGSYDYLLVVPGAGGPHWVATLHEEARPRQVRVKVLARAERFESRRLSRLFEPLEFGLVDAPPAVP